MKLTKKRGFSLVELMVVVAIMGTLAAIAIPAYNEYRKSAKKTSYRTDLLSLHKGWLAFGVELDSFCERETIPTAPSFNSIGMRSLLSSKLYGVTRTATCTSTLLGAGCTGCSLNAGQTDCTGTTASCTNSANDGQACAASAAFIPARTGPGKENFVGFGAATCSGVTLAANQHYMQDNSARTDADCDLDVSEYKMGSFGHISGATYIATQVDHNGVVSERNEGAMATVLPTTCS